MKTAIILSQGMLHEEVNTNKFIKWIISVAEQHNKDFNMKLLGPGFALSDQFNLGKIKDEEFREGLLKALGIPGDAIHPNEFWERWNSMVIVGNVVGEIAELQEFSQHNEAILYFNADTNTKHFEKMQADYPQGLLRFNADNNNMAEMANFPLYTTFAIHKKRLELIQHIVLDIKGKEFNKPEQIKLIMGHPENIANPAHRVKEENELKEIQSWCEANQVDLVLHKKTQPLLETLQICIALPIESTRSEQTPGPQFQ